MIILALLTFLSLVFSIPHVHLKHDLETALNDTYHFDKGVVETIPETVEDIGEMFIHPKETYHHLEFELAHPNKTEHAVKEAIKEKCKQTGSSECYGKVVGNVLLMVATDGVGELAEGLEVAGTVQKGAQVADVTHVTGLGNNAGSQGYSHYNGTTNSTKKEEKKQIQTTVMLPTK